MNILRLYQLVRWMSSGFENPSNKRFSEAGGCFSLAGSNSLATPRKILQDDHSDPGKKH